MATHQIVVHIESDLERDITKDKTAAAIVEQLQAAGPPDTKEIRAARKLESGDLRIFASSDEAKEKLLAKDGWIKVLGDTAKVVRPPTMVEVRFIPTNTELTTEWTQEAQHANGRFAPGLRILKVSWKNKGALQMKAKKHTSVILRVEPEEAANLLIKKGIAINGRLHAVERYDAAFKATQCFKCQAYGHISTHCKREARCGECAGSHNTKECNKAEAVKKCANCRKDHTSWNKNCHIRQQAHQRAINAKLSTPGLYEQGRKSPVEDTDGPPQFQFQTRKTANPRKRGRPSDGTPDGTPEPAERRRPGRPTNFERAGAMKNQRGVAGFFVEQRPETSQLSTQPSTQPPQDVQPTAQPTHSTQPPPPTQFTAAEKEWNESAQNDMARRQLQSEASSGQNTPPEGDIMDAVSDF